jgi:hypothetical protein
MVICLQILASFHRWLNYFPQPLNVHRVSVVKHTEMRTAELFVPDPNPFGTEIAIAKLKGINRRQN